MKDCNAFYRQFTGTETYYRYLANVQITDGTKEIAEKERCFWFYDIIVSVQQM